MFSKTKTFPVPISLVVTLALLVFLGCRKSGPPEALSPDRAATELTSSFAKSKPELKEIATRAVAALQAGRYPEASALLMQLSQSTELAAPQRELATRAMIGVNQLLQAAQAKGDPQSAEYLRRVEESK